MIITFFKFCLSILDFYQLTNSTSDFKSRSNDVFDKLTNLEKQHDIHTKVNTPISVHDDEAPPPPPSSSSDQNPNIPSHAITFKKRPADDTFARPTNKWKKYDLDDVNAHHLSDTGNRHALNDYLRTRVKPSNTDETEEETSAKPIFQRPMKKQILTHDNEDDDDNNNDDHFIPVRVPLPSNTTETKTENDNDDETIKYKLKSVRKQPRGVLSTNEKKTIKPSIELFQEKDNDDDDDNDDEDVDDELFEP
ncbi:unnamed protein product [Rotaria sp. Silwood2]|nr:unnamed protein product [Rotaria sp. Silwood2]CAF4103400.1 unnamed protein product [Rotaria sp. Silwood2]CAF4217112.1 unnamed protein product [Rotaria sp. Silwood2]